MKFRFQLKAFLAFLLLFLIEILIALYVHDQLIRPYGGDLLVVLLIFYFVKSFIEVRTLPAVIAVFLFACAVETAQYFNLVAHLGLQHNTFWRVVIGSSFHWLDIVAYALGAICILILERVTASRRTKH